MHPDANPALALGIASLAGAFCCAPGGIVLGILAILHGRRAERALEGQPGRFSGAGNATAGRVLGILGLAFSVVAVVTLLALAATALLSTEMLPGIPFREVPIPSG